MKIGLIQTGWLIIGLVGALLMEILSFISFFIPPIENSIAILLIIVFIILSRQKLYYGVACLFAELAIGGHGYFISLSLFNFDFSLRHIWFVLLIIIFAYKTYKKEIKFILPKQIKNIFIFLLCIVLFAFGLGIIKGNNFLDVFFDANAYIFLLLVFPLSYVLRDKHVPKIISNILLGALAVLSIKTLLTLYIFSHGLSIAPSWYVWVRDLRFGEIVYVASSFYRVFFQSQIFLSLAFFLIASYYIFHRQAIKRNEALVLFILTILYSASFIISFSRSFWLGLIVGLLVWFLLIYKNKNISGGDFLSVLKRGVLIVIAAILLITSLQSQMFNPKIFFNRVGGLDEDVAIISRWELAAKMFDGIKTNFIFGSGFGTRVTYKTSDPRIIAESGGTGEYSTYSFEWGYLDFWLKMGIIGLASWIYFIYLIMLRLIHCYKKNQENFYLMALISAETSLIIIHVFSPYLNHPLGISFLLLGLF